MNRFFSLFCLLALLSQSTYSAAPKRDFYEIRIYHLSGKAQEERVERYLKNAYLPALHRAGIKEVGVFKPVETDTAAGKRIYVYTPLRSLDQVPKLLQQLEKDKQYLADGQEYLEAAWNNPPYQRIETILLEAFDKMPRYRKPTLDSPRSQQIYELRSYEGATEKLYNKKVEMFNTGGEIAIFESLGFNAVFYGKALSGRTMPNLMYLTTFTDKASRDAHWKSFSSDPAWKALSGKSEYDHTVSKNNTYFLRPTEYSDI
ncbi:NIPSNAP family protein [Rhabdobacter roseus]|uniref:NIPSNAP domain-containing protein n=1 Tax=Rhabdobacter roseus TaxID=1655419 RepID=A0A840U5I8_9BACT|nr:NIPSNAP family protein [Rhabdobacter roseus]MBB5287578.1 hypothetical protein [Rhabdobacter roseus]